jgi:hypothetical protein
MISGDSMVKSNDLWWELMTESAAAISLEILLSGELVIERKWIEQGDRIAAPPPEEFVL